MDVVFLVVFLTLLIVPQLVICYELKGRRQGLTVKEWILS